MHLAPHLRNPGIVTSGVRFPGLRDFRQVGGQIVWLSRNETCDSVSRIQPHRIISEGAGASRECVELLIDEPRGQ